MTTITINERTKAGKTLLELAKMLSATNKGVIIDTNTPATKSKQTEKPRYNAQTEKAIQDAKKGIGITEVKSLEDFRKQLYS